LKNVFGAKNLQNDLSIFLSSSNRPSKPWMGHQDLCFGNDLACDDPGERWMFAIKKFNESIEVGKSFIRPFKPHRSRQFRNAGVPQVSSQRTTSSFEATDFWASNAFQRRSNSAISSLSARTEPASRTSNSANNSGTLTPRSSARCLSAFAVTSSISMVWVFMDRSIAENAPMIHKSAYCRRSEVRPSNGKSS